MGGALTVLIRFRSVSEICLNSGLKPKPVCDASPVFVQLYEDSQVGGGILSSSFTSVVLAWIPASVWGVFFPYLICLGFSSEYFGVFSSLPP